MRKLWITLNRPIYEMIGQLRYGAQLLALLYFGGGAYLNYVFVYALVSGKMKLKYQFEWIEGRESFPSGYWIFVAGFGGAAIMCDICFFWVLRKAFRKP